MNNLASYSPLFHTAICYWGFKMVLFIIIEWAFLNLATVFTSLLYLLPPQCLCSPEFCLQTRVRSTSRASTSGKSCRPTQWVLEIKTGPFLSEAAWNFSWIYTHQHFGISQAAFFVPRVEVSSWKPVSVNGWEIQFVERIVVLPPSSWAVSFGIQNIPLLFWSWRVKQTEKERKGGKVHLHSSGTVPLASHPVITLFICLSLNEHWTIPTVSHQLQNKEK